MAWAVQCGESSFEETYNAQHWLPSSGNSEYANLCQVHCNRHVVKAGHD